jgi:hypothetical protein
MSNQYPFWLNTHSQLLETYKPNAQDLTIEATLGCIPYYTASLTLADNTFQAITLFEADFSLPGILLQEQDTLIGVLSRQRFFEWMSRPFSLELFSRRSLEVLWRMMPHSILVLNADLIIAAAARRALERPFKDIYEPVIVGLGQQQFGVIDIHSLLLAQNIIHELTQTELQSHKQALLEERDLAQIT